MRPPRRSRPRPRPEVVRSRGIASPTETATSRRRRRVGGRLSQPNAALDRRQRTARRLPLHAVTQMRCGTFSRRRFAAPMPVSWDRRCRRCSAPQRPRSSGAGNALTRREMREMRADRGGARGHVAASPGSRPAVLANRSRESDKICPVVRHREQLDVATGARTERHEVDPAVSRP